MWHSKRNAALDACMSRFFPVRRAETKIPQEWYSGWALVLLTEERGTGGARREAERNPMLYFCAAA